MEKSATRGVIYGAFVVLACFATTGHANENFRLPNGTFPQHYTLRLDTAIDQNVFNYTGNVQISIAILEPTYQIVLHSTRSTISKIQLRNSVGEQVLVKNIKLDNLREFLVIETATLLRPGIGTYTLEIDFTNSVDRADKVGFYKASYLNENEVTRHIGVTHFEPINARSAFPCFDEPGWKSTFELHIACGQKYHVRSNTPVRTILVQPDGKRLYSFTRTPRMSTYLVAWLVSDFVSKSIVSDRSGLTVATWAKPASSHLLSYSVDASVRFVRAMEQYLAERYSLPKIDNVALPQGYLPGEVRAMENWGLVTYREKSIYVNPQIDGMDKKRAVANIIAHEYAHQIFGNLLTPAWWSYVWLKEGFAHFYTYYLGSISHPEHNLRKRFITETLQLTFSLDRFASVQPMTRYVEQRNDFQKLYSYVIYHKAACVIRMMNYALGERIFQAGIRDYIQRNKDSGIVTEHDLFNSLDLVAKKESLLPKHLSVHEVLRTWSHQAGYPVVSVRREGDKYFFTQQRYVVDPKHEPFNNSWWIPITFSTANNTAHEKLPAFWMDPSVSEVSYTIPTSPREVVVFNPQATGLYRVEYDGTMQQRIIQQLSNNYTEIEPTARARLIDDTLQLSFIRGNNLSAVLQILSYLRHETDILPWSIASENIRYMQSMLRTDAKASQLLQSFIETIVTPLLSRHDLHRPASGSDSTDELQSIAIELACEASESCRKASESICHPARHNASTRYGATDRALLCYGLQHSDVHDREAFIKQMSHGLKESIGCLGTAINSTGSYANFLFHLSDSVRPKELHRLIVVSKVSPSVLLASVDYELSLRNRKTFDQTSISKTLIAISRYAMEPSEAKLLLSVASTYAAEIVPQIEQQLMINRRWVERNVQPLTDALTRFIVRKT